MPSRPPIDVVDQLRWPSRQAPTHARKHGIADKSLKILHRSGLLSAAVVAQNFARLFGRQPRFLSLQIKPEGQGVNSPTLSLDLDPPHNTRC